MRWRHGMAAVAMVLAVLAAGCETDDGEVAFEVVATETQPASARVGGATADEWPPVMPGAEVAVAGTARDSSDIAALWDQVGFREPMPSLADEQALVVIAGGTARACPWQVAEVVSAHNHLNVRLAPAGEPTDCASPARQWQPRAVALTVPATALPSDDASHSHAVDLQSIPPLLLPSPVVPLEADGAAWSHFATGSDPYELSRQESMGGPPCEACPDNRPKASDEPDSLEPLPQPGTEPSASSDGQPEPARLTRRRPMAVTSLPGLDVIQFRLDWRKQRGDLSATYIATPPVDVDGETFLQIRLHHTTTAVGLRRRIEAPPHAAITELVRVPDTDALTWVVGLDGDTTPVAEWSSTYEDQFPDFTGWTRTIAIRHTDTGTTD